MRPARATLPCSKASSSNVKAPWTQTGRQSPLFQSERKTEKRKKRKRLRLQKSQNSRQRRMTAVSPAGSSSWRICPRKSSLAQSSSVRSLSSAVTSASGVMVPRNAFPAWSLAAIRQLTMTRVSFARSVIRQSLGLIRVFSLAAGTFFTQSASAIFSSISGRP